jgi:hypothetical protein
MSLASKITWVRRWRIGISNSDGGPIRNDVTVEIVLIDLVVIVHERNSQSVLK